MSSSMRPMRAGSLVRWAIPFVLISMGLIAATGARAAGGTVGPDRRPIALPMSPLSPSLLVAQAVHQGRYRPGASTGTASTGARTLTLFNVQASGGGQPVNEDPIAVNPKNSKDLLTGGNDYNCASLQGFYGSRDGGKTWTRGCMPVMPNYSGCGDPAVAWDLNGVAYRAGIDCNGPTQQASAIVVQKSVDLGVTWGPLVTAITPTFPSGLTDKEWLEVDNNPTSPHAGTLYISLTQFDASGFIDEIGVASSTDSGQTWTTTAVDGPQGPPTIDQFSDLAIARDGTVYVSWMRCTDAGTGGTGCAGQPATMVMSKSMDKGAHWTSPTTIATVDLAPDACGCAFYGSLPHTSERVSDIPVIAVDTSTGTNAGHLYATFYTWTGASMKVEVSTSKDGGVTWSQPVAVAPSTATHDQFFPWLSVSKSGTVGVTWLDRRGDPNNVTYQAFQATSGNGATSFSKNKKLSTVPSNPLSDGFGGGFMGDYTGNAWAGRTLFASWMDTRTGRSQDEVGAYIRT